MRPRPTDTSERGLESLIVAAFTGQRHRASPPLTARCMSPPVPYGGGYVQGDPADYDRDHAVNVAKLVAFLNATQPKVVETLALDADGPRRRQFLDRLQGEVAKRGVIDVLRRGIKHRPFHRYTMKQAIQEGFILDVLANYTPVQSYYRLLKTAPDDPEVDVKKARKKLRRYVESHDHAIRQKAEIVVNHFFGASAGPAQTGRRGALHGGDERHCAGHPVLPQGCRQDSAGDRRGDPGQGRRRSRVPERSTALGQAERPHRARQGTGFRVTELLADHTELFKIQRQPVFPQMAGRHDFRGDV